MNIVQQLSGSLPSFFAFSRLLAVGRKPNKCSLKAKALESMRVLGIEAIG